MYRDSVQSLDEHDGVVGAILIGEALIDCCDQAARSCAGPETPATEKYRAVQSVHDTYPEIWLYLDRARTGLAHRGANTVRYDELRPHVKRAATDSEAERVDTEAIDGAKRAIAELKLAVPGTDWKAIAARTTRLVHAPLGHRKNNQKLVLSIALGAILLGVFGWCLAIIPEHKPTRRETMKRELASIKIERKSRIDVLSLELGDRCLPDAAHDLVRLMVLDGRTQDARDFGTTYVARCGADPVVETWAKAPRPGH
ncbi:MAG TPA: hypothetical protein VGC41_08875 [Kofleriaceae bacterium]